MTYYKFLNGNLAPHTNYPWPLPNGDKPGKWVHAKGELDVCRNGIHAVTLDEGSEIFAWLHDDCYEVELGGRIITGEGKVCARRGRLLRKTPWSPQLRASFAADCAERVLDLVPKPHRARAGKAIKAARAWAECPCPKHARAAATYAADTAADTAAYAVAYAAERQWQLDRLGQYLRGEA